MVTGGGLCGGWKESVVTAGVCCDGRGSAVTGGGLR